MRLYIDSNVVISKLLCEFGRKYEFMEDAVNQFLVFCARNRHVLLLSDVFFEEVKRNGYTSREGVSSLLADILVEELETTRNDLECAGLVSNATGITGPDAIHICLAKRARADYIITWNIKHFRRPGVPIRSLTPREFVL